MKLKVRFSESGNSFKMKFAGTEKSFKPKFGTVYNVSDDSYQKGYEEGLDDGFLEGFDVGYEDGVNDTYQGAYDEGYDDAAKEFEPQLESKYQEGYEQGKKDGYADGYSVGYAEGYAKGKTDGYNEGYSKGDTDGYDRGYGVGKTDGYDEGYTAGKAEGGNTDEAYQQGVTDGKQAEHEAFWNSYLNRSSLTYAFYEWDAEIFYPTKDIRSTNFNYSFANFNKSGTTINLVSRLASCKSTLDTSQATAVGNMFYNANIGHLGVINLTKATGIVQVFYGCKALVTIDELVMPSSLSVATTNTFYGCTELRNIKISGQIGNAIAFSPCNKLTHDSLMSIINALAKLTTSKKLTLGSNNLAKLTEAEKQQIEAKGWTYA